MHPLRHPRLLVSVLALISPIPAISAIQKFTLNSGRELEAEIVDAIPGQVTLRKDGRETKSLMTDYSAADRDFFREWMRENRGIFDWPTERGYQFDGRTSEQLPPVAPAVLWRAKVGAGDSPVVVGNKNAFATGVRDGRFFLVSLGLENGTERWTKSYRVAEGTARAIASPAIDQDEGLVISMGPSGRIDGWRTKDGENVWSTILQVKYRDAEPPLAGVYGSPLTRRARIYLEVGGPTYSLVSLANSNGSELWRIGKHSSLGATPAVAKIGDRSVVVSRNQYGIVGRDAESGTMSWDQAWEGGGRASPLPLGGDRVFVTAEKTCAMFRIAGNRTEPVWSSTVMCSSFASPVFYDGFLYGFNGDDLTCVNADSGAVVWKQPGIGAGNLICAGDKLLIQTGKSGELVVADASPAKFNELSRTKVFEGESRTTPVFVNGRIFCRSAAGDITCLDVREEK